MELHNRFIVIRLFYDSVSTNEVA